MEEEGFHSFVGKDRQSPATCKKHIRKEWLQNWKVFCLFFDTAKCAYNRAEPFCDIVSNETSVYSHGRVSKHDRTFGWSDTDCRVAVGFGQRSVAKTLSVNCDQSPARRRTGVRRELQQIYTIISLAIYNYDWTAMITAAIFFHRLLILLCGGGTRRGWGAGLSAEI